MTDKEIIRELAKQYMEIALSEKQQKMFQRMKETNDLKIVRPPVLIAEIPWHEMNMDNELTCVCQEERARKLEIFFRRAIFQWKHFRADTMYEPFMRVTMAYDSTGIGIKKNENVLRTDQGNNIVSHQYIDLLEDESVLETLHIPEFTMRPDLDEKNMNFYTDLLGEAMPVKLCGQGCVHFHPWDDITELRGLENVLMDLYDRPEYMHRLISFFCTAITAKLDFLEKNSHIDPNATDIHKTPGAISGLAEDGWKATWFRGTAQAFGCVSPEMVDEFEIDYIKPIAERFGYTYYGCCEALDQKVGIVRKISNLRKVGVSPWANIEIMAEQIGGDFVYARKPNPANVAISTDPEVIRKEIEDTVKVCMKYGCPSEYVLKDISTVSYKPENLIVWSKIASEVMDAYYGEA